MAKYRQNLGKWGEKLAGKYLLDHGYKIREQNVRTAYGEIDLIASNRNCVVFVEVKTRQSNIYGPPENAITEIKKERLIQSALAYMQKHPELGNDWRIDVISIQHYEPGPPEITHFENAVNN